MRAKSPLDALEHKGERVALPLPRIAIGTRLKPLPKQPDYAFYRKRMLRELLRDTRRIVDRLRREGFINGKPGERLPDFNKKAIRRALHIYEHSTDVEVAGICPEYGPVFGNPTNQCYLQHGHTHSGVGYTYYLLFRMELDGNRIVLIHSHPVGSEGRLQVDLTAGID